MQNSKSSFSSNLGLRILYGVYAGTSDIEHDANVIIYAVYNAAL